MKPRPVDLSVSIRSTAVPENVKAEVLRALECYFTEVAVRLVDEEVPPASS